MPKQNIAEKVLNQKTEKRFKKHSEEQVNSEENFSIIKEGLDETQKSVLLKCKEKLPFMNENELLKICLKHDFNAIIIESIVDGLWKRSQDTDEGDWLAIEQSAPKKQKNEFQDHKPRKFNKKFDAEGGTNEKWDKNDKPRTKNFHKKEERPESRSFKHDSKKNKAGKLEPKKDQIGQSPNQKLESPIKKNIEMLLAEDEVKEPISKPNNDPLKEGLVIQEEPKFTLVKKYSHEVKSPKKSSYEIVKEGPMKKMSEGKHHKKGKAETAILILPNGSKFSIQLPEGFSQAIEGLGKSSLYFYLENQHL